MNTYQCWECREDIHNRGLSIEADCVSNAAVAFVRTLACTRPDWCFGCYVADEFENVTYHEAKVLQTIVLATAPEGVPCGKRDDIIEGQGEAS